MKRCRPFDPHWPAVAVLLLAVPFGCAGDGPLYRTSVPGRLLRVGEVRLLARNGRAVVQSIIMPPFIERARRRIERSEKRNWPDHPAAERYLEALASAVAECRRRRDDGGDRVALAISFVSGGTAPARVEFAFPHARWEGRRLVDTPAPVWRGIRIPSDYAVENQAYILRDAFGAGKAEPVLRTLRALTTRKENDEES